MCVCIDMMSKKTQTTNNAVYMVVSLNAGPPSQYGPNILAC